MGTPLPRSANDEVADVLDRVADLLEVQNANRFRVRAYRRGADTCRRQDRPLPEVLATEGLEGLDRLPGIGKSLAASIAEYVHVGRLNLLKRLEGEVAPEDLMMTVPSVGRELAHRIVTELGIDTLEGLDRAARDGRLAAVRGFGRRRVAAIRSAVGATLNRTRRRGPAAGRVDPRVRPALETVLAVDAEYRRAAEAGELRRIAPRLHNPERRTWLPILHVDRDGWRVTAHFSNSANAHRFGKTADWVVVIAERDGREDRSTVVTERRGPRAGQRVVRGREQEARDGPVAQTA